MDSRIYSPASFGVYGTRRFPRGGVAGYVAGLPVMGIPAELNPTPILLGFGDTQATDLAVLPRAEVEKVSYIVPLGRQLQIQAAIARSMRLQLVSLAQGEFRAWVEVYRRETPRQRTPIASCSQLTNVVGTMEQDNNNGVQTIFQGDRLSLRIWDDTRGVVPGGGQVKYDLQVIGVEYDNA